MGSFLPVADAADAPLSVSFQTPALVKGEGAARGHWIAVLIQESAPSSFSLDLADSGILTNETRKEIQYNAFGVKGHYPTERGKDVHPLEGSQNLRIEYPGEGFLLIEAESIEVAFGGSISQLTGLAGSSYKPFLIEDVHHNSMYPVRDFPDESAILYFQQETATVGVSFEARNVTHLSWLGARIQCEAEGFCPKGGGVQKSGATLPPDGDHAEVAEYWIESLETQGAALTGSATIKAGVVGGNVLDLDLNGSMRMPSANWNGACDSCAAANGQTASMSGELRIHGIQSNPGDGSMSATFDGAVASARLDEEVIDPASLTGATIAVGAVAVGGVVVVKFILGALFTRPKGNVLDHARRRRVYEYVVERPGANFREVARGVGTASGTARHHLTMLVRAGLLVERPHLKTVRFFPKQVRYEKDWERIVVLRDETMRTLYDWVEAHPQCPQKAILKGMQALGWSRSTTQHRLEKLIAAGLVAVRPQGRLVMHSAVPSPGPAPAPAYVGLSRLTQPAAPS